MSDNQILTDLIIKLKTEGGEQIGQLGNAITNVTQNLGHMEQALTATNEANSQQMILNARLRAEIERQTTRTQALAQEMRQLRASNVSPEEINATSRAYQQSATRLSRLREAVRDLDSVNEETAQSARQLAQSLDQVNDEASETKNTMGDLGKALGGALALGIVAKQALDFEASMSNVAKVTGANSQQLADLGVQVQELAVKFGISANEIAEMATAGGQLGVALEDLPKFIELAGKMAIAFNMTAEEAGQSASVLANVFGIPILQVGKLADAINVLGNNTSAKESEIINVLTRIGGSANAIGITAEQASALAGAMLALGKTPETAGTALNALLQRLQTGGAGVAGFEAGLQKLGMTTDTLANKIKNNAQEAVMDFLVALEQMNAEDRSKAMVDLFGAQFADEMSLLVGSLNTYRHTLGLVSDANKTAGALTAEFEAKMKTAQAKINQATEAFKNLGIVLGNQFLPILGGVAQSVGGVAQALGRLAKDYPQVTGAITNLASAMVLGKVGMLAYNGALALLPATLTATATTANVATGALARLNAMGGKLGILIALSTAIGAFKALNSQGHQAFRELSDASEKAQDEIKKFNSELDKTGKADIAQLKKSIDATNDALGKGKLALEQMNQEFDKIHDHENIQFSGIVDWIADGLPFVDSLAEKIEKAEVHVKRLEQEHKNLNQIQEQTAEKVKTVEENFQAMSEKAKMVNQALASGELKDDLKEINTELEAINNSYKNLGLEAPKALQILTQSDRDVLSSLQKISEQTKLTASEMQELMTRAMEKIETEPAREKLKEFAQNWKTEQEKMIADMEKQHAELSAKQGKNVGVILQNNHLALKQQLNDLEKNMSTLFDAPIGKARELAKETEKATEEARKASEKALSALGLSLIDLNAGVSNGVLEMTNNWQLGMDNLKQSGQLTADAVKKAFENSIGNLKTAEDFKLFEQTLNETGTKAQLTAEQLNLLNAGLNGGSQAVSELNQKKNELNKTQEQSNQTIKQNIQVNNEAVQAQKELSQATEETIEAQNKLHSSTIKLYDSAGLTAEQIAQLTKISKEYTSAFNKYYGQTGMHDHLEVLGASIKATSIAMAGMNKYLDELDSKISNGSVSVEDLNYHIENTGKGMIKLDNATLSRYYATIDKAREKLKQLADDAKAVADDIEADLSRLNGDESLGMKLEQERKIKALEAKLKEAERQKNVDAVAQYQRAISLQQQYNTKETEQYQQRKQEEKQREIEQNQRNTRDDGSYSHDRSKEFAREVVTNIREENQKAFKAGQKAGREGLMKDLKDAQKRSF